MAFLDLSGLSRFLDKVKTFISTSITTHNTTPSSHPTEFNTINTKLTTLEEAVAASSPPVVAFGTSETAAADTTKAVTTIGAGFKLVPGARLSVRFTNMNTTTNMNLNVDNTGIKSVYFLNSLVATSKMLPYSILDFVYTGEVWYCIGAGSIKRTISVTAASWSNAASVGGYYRDFGVPGLTVTDLAYIGLEQSSDAASAAVQRSSYANIARAYPAAGEVIRLICPTTIPPTTITLNVEVRKW